MVPLHRPGPLVLLTVLVLGATALAGCHAPDHGAETFWMVRVEGELVVPEESGVCDVMFSHRVNETARTVEGNPTMYDEMPTKPRVILAADAWQKPSDCPLWYTLWFDRTEFTLEAGTSGDWTLVIDETDGSVQIDNKHVAVGGELRLDYQAADGGAGFYVIRPLGAWPASGWQLGT